MNRKTCPDCGERSYFSGSGADWDCPYCGKYLGEYPSEQKPWRYSTSLRKPENIKVPLVQKASKGAIGFLVLLFGIGITLVNCNFIPGTYSYFSDHATMSVQFQAADTFPEATAEEASEASGTDVSSPAESGDAEGTGDSQEVKSETGSETEVSAPAATGDAGENGDSQEVVDEASSGTDESAPVASGNAE